MTVSERTVGRLLEGGPIAAEIRAAVAEDVASFTVTHGRPPGLAVVIIGREAPSAVYLEQILRGCAKVGIAARFAELEGEATEASIVARIRDLNADPEVDGAIVQMPLPRLEIDVALGGKRRRQGGDAAGQVQVGGLGENSHDVTCGCKAAASMLDPSGTSDVPSREDCID